MPGLRVTTNPGLEDVTVREVSRLLADAGIAPAAATERPSGHEGVVRIDLDVDEADLDVRNRLALVLRAARSVYHVVLHTGEVEWHGQPLPELAREIGALSLEAMETARSFRVTCSRTGEHPFHSPDVEREVGSALQARYGTAVSLEGYEVNVRVDISGSECLVGYQLTGKKGLDRRYAWRYHPRVTLRTTVAYAMLDVAGFAAHPGSLHDPFCGSGTILLEAAALAGAVAAGGQGTTGSDAPTISGSDLSVAAVAGCRENLVANDAAEIDVWEMDAREMGEHLPPARLDYIVTNPPYGIRMGRNADFGLLYRTFLEQAAVVLRPGGVLALLVGRRRGRFNKVLQQTVEFRLEHVRIIEIGGVYPGLFVLRRLEGV